MRPKPIRPIRMLMLASLRAWAEYPPARRSIASRSRTPRVAFAACARLPELVEGDDPGVVPVGPNDLNGVRAHRHEPGDSHGARGRCAHDPERPFGGRGGPTPPAGGARTR